MQLPNKNPMNDIEYLNIALTDFETIAPSTTPFFYDFSSKTIGKGRMGTFSPATDMLVFYVKFFPGKDYLWKSEKIDTSRNVVFFNYIMQAPEGMRTSIDDANAKETLCSRTLLIDGTNAEHKTLWLVGNEFFEIFQIAVSEEVFLNQLADCCPKVYADYVNRNINHIYERESMGLLLPFDVVEERCIHDIIHFSMVPELQKFFTVLKINELMMHYYQRILNNEIGKTVAGEKISLAERDKLVKIKKYLDDNLNADLDLELLSKRFHLSSVRINKLFLEVLGYSIGKYFKRQKLNKAYSMLLNMDNKFSVKEVAFTLGYQSVANFSRSFYNQFNIRPSEINLKVKDLTFEI